MPKTEKPPKKIWTPPEMSYIFREKPPEQHDLVFAKYGDILYGLPKGYILVEKADLIRWEKDVRLRRLWILANQIREYLKEDKLKDAKDL